MRVLIALGASVLLLLALVAPVAAKGSCKEFGEVTSDWAKSAGGIGSVISSVASSGPGTVSEIVAGEHATMCGN
jgi:hypothetical protein